jgi:hypothetical protein
MAKVICAKDMSIKTREFLKESIKRVVQNNKEVFDELAKK